MNDEDEPIFKKPKIPKSKPTKKHSQGKPDKHDTKKYSQTKKFKNDIKTIKKENPENSKYDPHEGTSRLTKREIHSDDDKWEEFKLLKKAKSPEKFGFKIKEEKTAKGIFQSRSLEIHLKTSEEIFGKILKSKL